MSDLYLVFGYEVAVNKKLNGSGPGSLIATKLGYQPQNKKCKIDDYVIAKRYFYGFIPNKTVKELDKLLGSINISHLTFDTKSVEIVKYMNVGSSFSGLQDSDFSFDIRSIPFNTFKLDNIAYLSILMYCEELTTLSKVREVGTIHYIEDTKFWTPKVTKPYWLFGNTLMTFNDKGKKAFVSVSTSLIVKKDQRAVKNNNIHKILSDTNYTISLTSDSDVIDRVNDSIPNELNIPLLIKPKELLNANTIRAFNTSEHLDIMEFYNNKEFCAINGSSVLVQFSPPGLLFKMQTEIFRTIHTVLNNKDREEIDITKYLLGDDGKINKAFINSEVIKIPYKGKNIIVKLGIDTLPKNNFKKIEKDFKLKLLIYSYKKVYRYYTVVEDNVNKKKLISYAPFNSKGIR